jgi:hypothetical protein
MVIEYSIEIKALDVLSENFWKIIDVCWAASHVFLFIVVTIWIPFFICVTFVKVV